MDLTKYPKTMHLPWSPGLQNDDRRIESLDTLKECEVVVTEKMDGENASLYRDTYHARSLDGRHHPSRDWIKSFHGQIAHTIPEDMRICGENMYAEHSIRYERLRSYFLGFSIWNNSTNNCLDWDTTKQWFDGFGINPVLELWRGSGADFLEQHEHLDALVEQNQDTMEGYVVRVVNQFHYDDFGTCVAKYVRRGHVQTDEHWMHKPVVANGLKK